MVKTKVWVYFEKGRAYIRTANASLRIPAGYRMKFRGHGLTVNGVWFPWACSYDVADEVVPLNASVSSESMEVEYLNATPDIFYRTKETGATYKRICKNCVREFIEGSSVIERMTTNSKSVQTNVFGDAYPLLREGRIALHSGQCGNLVVEGFTKHEVFTILKYAEVLKQENQMSPYINEWLNDVVIPALETYLAALEMKDENKLKAALKAYTDTVEQVNSVLKEHAEEFDVSDDGQFGFDCGFITIGFTDKKLYRKSLFFKNHPNLQTSQVPEIHMPVYAQSLAVQCREFEKAKAIVKKELGLDIAILHSELD